MNRQKIDATDLYRLPWTLADNVGMDTAYAFAEFNNRLYVGYGGGNAEGDVRVCTPETVGDPVVRKLDDAWNPLYPCESIRGKHQVTSYYGGSRRLLVVPVRRSPPRSVART